MLDVIEVLKTGVVMSKMIEDVEKAGTVVEADKVGPLEEVTVYGLAGRILSGEGDVDSLPTVEG